MTSYKLKTNKNQSGLTLAETVVTVTIFTIISFVILNSVASFYRFNAYTISQSYQITNARRGVEYLVRDLREMTYSDDGSYPLVSMDDNEVGFYSDIDRDDSVEYVEYELVGTTLEKRIYNATGTPPVYSVNPDETDTISEYVQNIDQGTSTFAYYDYDGNLAGATSTVTDIRYIDVRVIVNIDPTRDPGEFMLRSSAALRNLVESSS